MSEEALNARVESSNAKQPASPLRIKTPAQGAATSIWVGFVADGDEIGGRYCEDCHAAELNVDTSLRAGVKSYAVDPDNARALWDKSEELVGERF